MFLLMFDYSDNSCIEPFSDDVKTAMLVVPNGEMSLLWYTIFVLMQNLLCLETPTSTPP